MKREEKEGGEEEENTCWVNLFCGVKRGEKMGKNTKMKPNDLRRSFFSPSFAF